ncbi:MAG: DUF2029 domain-containing protein [Candidatus Lokiarchaeota archaeon]|nr:DUF2029 domain-containing protein [Candidatus Lokiarchaeota archaeon]
MIESFQTSKNISILYLVSLALSIATNFVIMVFMRLVGSSMYPFFITMYIWTAAYMLLLSVLLRGIRLDYLSSIPEKYILALIIILTISSRTIFLGLTEYISLDSLWYLDFGNFMAHGNLPYSDFYFPYPPVFGYFIYFIYHLLPSVDSFRLLATFFDLLVVLALWKLAKQRTDSQWANFVGLAYAMLPMSIIESGWNGHFEPLVSFFVIISVYFLFLHRAVASGIFLGLATATKFFPGLLLPVFIFYFKTWRKRVEYVFSSVLTAVITILPFVLPALLTPSSGDTATNSSDTPSMIRLLLYSIFDPTSHPLVITLILLAGIGILFVIIIIQLLSGKGKENVLPYNIISGVLGIVLIAMGFIAAWYPLAPESRLVYWRYPADVGMVRGITACAAGLVIISIAFQRWRHGTLKIVSKETLMILTASVVLLMISIAREVFYGWYLLWALPLLFLLVDKRLMLMALLGLLLVYPSYTHDNFNSLGYEEEQIWNDDFTSIQGWNKYVNTSNSGIPTGVISAEAYVNESKGQFYADTTSVSEEFPLGNVSIVFRKDYDFRVEQETEFVIRAKCNWDPAFGRLADISLNFIGHDSENNEINGSIIPRTSIFTNLTNLLWRFSFSSLIDCNTSCTIDRLILTIYPVRIGEYLFSIDYIYTTHAGPLNPRYIFIGTTLITISFIAYVFLNIELARVVRIKKSP